MKPPFSRLREKVPKGRMRGLLLLLLLLLLTSASGFYFCFWLFSTDPKMHEVSLLPLAGEGARRADEGPLLLPLLLPLPLLSPPNTGHHCQRRTTTAANAMSQQCPVRS